MNDLSLQTITTPRRAIIHVLWSQSTSVARHPEYSPAIWGLQIFCDAETMNTSSWPDPALQCANNITEIANIGPKSGSRSLELLPCICYSFRVFFVPCFTSASTVSWNSDGRFRLVLLFLTSLWIVSPAFAPLLAHIYQLYMMPPDILLHLYWQDNLIYKGLPKYGLPRLPHAQVCRRSSLVHQTSIHSGDFL